MLTIKEIVLPDVGDFDQIEIIEVLVAKGDQIAVEDTMIVLESDKAAMEIPCSDAGTIEECLVKVGDKVSQGDLILRLSVSETEQVSEQVDTVAETKADATPVPVEDTPKVVAPPAPVETPVSPVPVVETSGKRAHAGPAVRHFARELGVDLSQVPGSGRKARILLEDVKTHVKQSLQQTPVNTSKSSVGGLAVAAQPVIDFSQFGEIATEAFSRIQKISSRSLHRNWVTIPHVTQFDEADITELEAFRKSLKAEAQQRDVRLTLMPFLIKAVAAGLKQFPRVNASLNADGDGLILKKYIHIGFAADTPTGLVVPVIKNADQMGLFELAATLMVLSAKARAGKLGIADMQGGCFTISSLGGIGGTAFTPIINAPELAILGVSRSQTKAVYIDGEFVPRLIVPLSLSYDHRAIDGAEGVRFSQYVSAMLADMRRLLL